LGARRDWKSNIPDSKGGTDLDAELRFDVSLPQSPQPDRQSNIRNFRDRCGEENPSKSEAAKLMIRKISGNLSVNLVFNTTLAFRTTAGCKGCLESGGISARQLDESPALRGHRRRESAHR
jgi:hypothetical protein